MSTIFEMLAQAQEHQRVALAGCSTVTVEATDPKAREEIAQLRAMLDGLAARVSGLARQVEPYQHRSVVPASVAGELEKRITLALSVLQPVAAGRCASVAPLEYVIRLLEGRE